ncbi:MULTISPECIES: metalloregulator ArsR/SmtB family transcription factor [unclassified Clostridium]|jgi:predicted transcriptional regulator|uniref:Helix-turn-helix transcriptional regulator n=1 Tax=Clostridium sulfidigenes TaxID=318464 RepID=A0A927W704_9CLOT|nr:helix-turn-helix transcriptional regulator [Clostridium sulfidigenes]
MTENDTFLTNPKLFEEKANILKALAHPVRLCIVKGLIETGGSNVTNMQNCLDMPQSTISQHIGKLKAFGIIDWQRNGLEIIYSVSDENIKKLIEVLF